jgi:DNA-binding NarL/FixJ family response regulator
VSDEPIWVLVVDDGASFRRAAASVIAATDGFALAGVAVSGAGAIAFLQRRPVALVLMDVCMPGMSGIETAAVLRARFADVMIVLLSVDPAQDLPDELTDGAVQFCSKAQFGPERLETLWQRKSSMPG